MLLHPALRMSLGKNCPVPKRLCCLEVPVALTGEVPWAGAALLCWGCPGLALSCSSSRSCQRHQRGVFAWRRHKLPYVHERAFSFLLCPYINVLIILHCLPNWSSFSLTSTWVFESQGGVCFFPQTDCQGSTRMLAVGCESSHTLKKDCILLIRKTYTEESQGHF